MQQFNSKASTSFISVACALLLVTQATAAGANFSTSCNQAADRSFNKGLNLLHNMMYIQAEEEFNKAAMNDPDCAMAHWGIAMSNFHPLWPGTPSEAETKRGNAAAEKLAATTSDSAVEEALIGAAIAFYASDLDGYRAQINAWADAQIKVAEQHPENIDAAALAALAHLATAPRGPGRTDVNAMAGDILDTLHQVNPDHPGVIHYAIHAYDNPALKERGIPYAEIYDKTAPNAPHALHMPAHIFTRTGEWEKSISLNRRSAEAALQQSKDVVQTHYAHAIDYLVYGHLQLGEAEKASQLVDEMMAIDNHQVNFGGAYALAAAPVRLLLEQDKWAEAAVLSEEMHPVIPWEKFPQTVAMHWYAIGLGAARSDNIATARGATSELESLHATIQERGQDYWARLTEVQIMTVEAWIELAEGNEELALTKQTAAADLEDEIGKSPVTPGHILPARELLGDMLVQLGRPEEATDAYKATLKLSPNRARSLAALE